MAKRTAAQQRVDEPHTDEAIFSMRLAELRANIREAIAPFIDGPLKERGSECFPLNLGDGETWYRPRDGMKKKQLQRFELLKRLALEAGYCESHSKPNRGKLTFFARAVRLGQFI